MSEEIVTSTYRKNLCWKTLYVNDYQLCGFRFYNEKGVILDYNYGYFEDNNILKFKGNVVKKLKENFTKKENYVLKKQNNYYDEKEYYLYIYVDNVDFKYIGLEKEYANIYRVYNVNGIKIKKFIKNLESSMNIYKNKIIEDKDKIQYYKLPFDENKLKEIIDNIVEYNNKIIEESIKIKNYEPKEEDFKNE